MPSCKRHGRNKVDSDRRIPCGKHPCTDGNFVDLPGYIADFLCDYEIDFPLITVRQKLRPGNSVFHVGRSRAVINVETNEFPHRILSQCRPKYFLVAFEIIVIFRLIEIADVDGYFEWDLGIWYFMTDGFQPLLMLSHKRRVPIITQAELKGWIFSFLQFLRRP